MAHLYFTVDENPVCILNAKNFYRLYNELIVCCIALTQSQSQRETDAFLGFCKRLCYGFGTIQQLGCYVVGTNLYLFRLCMRLFVRICVRQ